MLFGAAAWQDAHALATPKSTVPYHHPNLLSTPEATGCKFATVAAKSALTSHKSPAKPDHKQLTYMKACTVPAGYVHGKSPEICPHGCKPDPNLGRNETAVQTLIREALEFQYSVRLQLTLWIRSYEQCTCLHQHVALHAVLGQPNEDLLLPTTALSW